MPVIGNRSKHLEKLPLFSQSKFLEPCYLVTVSEADAVWFKLPFTPLMVSVYVFLVLVDSVFTVSVEVDDAGFGVNVTVDPEGCPVRLSVTEPLNPFVGTMVTLKVAVLPRRTDCDVGLTDSEKSAGKLATVTLAVPFTPPLDAVTLNGPPTVAPAVNNPEDVMVPPPPTDQVNTGCGLSRLPY